MVTGQTEGVEYQTGDITDYDVAARATADVDYVIHLAAIPFETGQARQIFDANCLGTFNVMDAAVRSGVSGFVFASTVATYGLLHPSQPWDPEYFPVDESSPLIPDGNYANMKIIGENFQIAYSRGFGMDSIALRLATVMNPGTEQWRQVHENIDDPEHIFVDGMTMREFLWQYVHVYDVAQAFDLAIRRLNGNRGLGFEAYNIGATETASTVPTLELLRRYFPDVPLLKNPVRFVENPHATLYGIDKAVAELGYQPRYTWRDLEV
jgi:nucleoside-diphosphate-sugar epimerase